MEPITSEKQLTRKVVNKEFYSIPKQASYFIKGLNEIFSEFEFDNINFKYDENPNIIDFRTKKPKWGIYKFIDGKWRWFGINTFETNYTCIFEVISDYNDLIDQKKINYDHITDEGLHKNFFKECDKFLLYIKENFSYIFGIDKPTPISRRLEIITNRTWYFNKIEEIFAVIQRKEMFEETYGLNYTFTLGMDRGEGDDYNHGIDFTETIGNITNNCQHKTISWGKFHYDLNTDLYTFDIKFPKKKYEHCDRLYVLCAGYYYIFDITNIYDPSIVVDQQTITIPKERQIGEPFKMKEYPLKTILKNIITHCEKLNISFDIFDANKEYVKLDENLKQLTIGLDNANINDIKEDLEEILNYLMVLTNS